jgi:ubiquinone/menaquinone biosynthesis C-methylase UbiE
MEERKLKEIEHSRRRRQILQGYERSADTHPDEAVEDLEKLVMDEDAFRKHYSNMKFYSIARASEDYYHDWLRQHSKDAVVLDYCCGNGENGIFSAACGGNVTGIDISPEAIENAKLNAIREGVDKNTHFEVMDAENMDFKDATFDTIVCYGALHHLDYERAMKELGRVVKPDGAIVCIEALKHNPFFHLYRKLTPHLRTEWEVEHILSVDNLEVSRRYFGSVEPRFFHLTALAAVPLRRTRFFKPLLGALNHVDNLLLKSPVIGKYGWMMVFTMQSPLSRRAD